MPHAMRGDVGPGFYCKFLSVSTVGMNENRHALGVCRLDQSLNCVEPRRRPGVGLAKSALIEGLRANGSICLHVCNHGRWRVFLRIQSPGRACLLAGLYDHVGVLVDLL